MILLITNFHLNSLMTGWQFIWSYKLLWQRNIFCLISRTYSYILLKWRPLMFWGFMAITFYRSMWILYILLDWGIINSAFIGYIFFTRFSHRLYSYFIPQQMTNFQYSQITSINHSIKVCSFSVATIIPYFRKKKRYGII